MLRISPPLVATLLASGMALSACSGGTPSKDDLAGTLAESGGFDAEISECIAAELLDSDLSDDQLNAVADDDESGLSSEEVDEIGEVLLDASESCST